MQWTETHDYLELVMKRELETLRQLLENMHMEEELIRRKEKKYLGRLMQERERLLEQLEAIRLDKVYIIKKLAALFSRQEVPLEELLPPASGASFEILSLRDQMAALLDRVSLQKSRTEMVKSLVEAQLKRSPKKKIAVATLSPEEYKDRND